MLGSTLLAYSTENLLVFLAAWILSIVPFLLKRWFRVPSWRPSSPSALEHRPCACDRIICGRWPRLSIEALKGRSPGGMAAFGFWWPP